MLSALPSPVIFAHRGASAHAPENTLAAFQLALEQKAEGIELDVHLSADGEVVVIHDIDVSRTTGGHGLIHSLTIREIRQLDAGNGETVPTLEEVLDLIKDQMLINVELKGFSTTAQGLAEKVTEVVQSYQLGEKIIYSSFNPRLLLDVRRRLPDAKIGLLFLPGALGGVLRFLLVPVVRPWSIHPHHASVSSGMVRRGSQKQRPIICYTVNEVEEMRRLFALGVAGIITDDPALAVQTREVAQ